MRMRKRILLYSGLACAVLALAPATAAAAKTGAPAARMGADAPPLYTTVSTNGWGLPGNSSESGYAQCPKNEQAISGGAYIASSSLMTGINSSYPEPGVLGRWDATVQNFSGSATKFNVYAVCTGLLAGNITVTFGPFSNPAGDQDSATVSCSSGDVISGGVIATSSSSVGMTSSYPSSSTSWTAAVSNFSGTGESFDVFLTCASASALPNYAIASTTASDPAGVQKGIIQDCPGSAVVIGGGNRSSNTSNLRIEMKTTQPFPASGTGWKSGENNDTSVNTKLTSYAICAT
jgi:hypothetical protein